MRYLRILSIIAGVTVAIVLFAQSVSAVSKYNLLVRWYGAGGVPCSDNLLSRWDQTEFTDDYVSLKDKSTTSAHQAEPAGSVEFRGGQRIDLDSAVTLVGNGYIKWSTNGILTDGEIVLGAASGEDYVLHNASSDELLVKINNQTDVTFTTVVNQEFTQDWTLTRTGTTLALTSSLGGSWSETCVTDDFVFDVISPAAGYVTGNVWDYIASDTTSGILFQNGMSYGAAANIISTVGPDGTLVNGLTSDRVESSLFGHDGFNTLGWSEGVTDNIELWLDPITQTTDAENFSTYDEDTGICQISSTGTYVTLYDNSTVSGKTYEIIYTEISKVYGSVALQGFGTEHNFTSGSETLILEATAAIPLMKRASGFDDVTFTLSIQEYYAGKVPASPTPIPVSLDTIVVIGDSFADGNLPYLRAAYRETFFVGKGNGGDATAAVLARFQSDVVDVGADHVVLIVGVNDAFSGVPLVTAQSNILSIVALAETNNIGITFAEISPTGNHASWTTAIQTFTDDFNLWINSYAVDRGYEVAGIYSAMRDGVTDNLLAAYDNGDGLHFNAAGYSVSGSLYASLLQTTYRTGRDIYGNTLTYSGKASENLKVSGYIPTFAGSETLTLAHLTGAETVTTKTGTSTVAVVSGGLTFTAGTVQYVLLSDGTELIFEGSSAADDDQINIYNVDGTYRHGALVGATTPEFDTASIGPSYLAANGAYVTSRNTIPYGASTNSNTFNGVFDAPDDMFAVELVEATLAMQETDLTEVFITKSTGAVKSLDPYDLATIDFYAFVGNGSYTHYNDDISGSCLIKTNKYHGISGEIALTFGATELTFGAVAITF